MSATTEKLISVYLQMRDDIAAKDKAAKEAKSSIVDSMNMIEDELYKRLKKEKLTTFSTDAGTAFETTNDYVGIEEFDDFLGFLISSILTAAGLPPTPATLKQVLAAADLQFLNKAVNKTAVKDFMEENEGKLPPGIKYTKEIVIQIRKK